MTTSSNSGSTPRTRPLGLVALGFRLLTVLMLSSASGGPTPLPGRRRAKGTSPKKPYVAEQPPPGRMAYNVKETAWVLGCSPNSVWNLLTAGQLHGFTLNRKRMIAVAELERFMAQGGTVRAYAKSAESGSEEVASAS